MSDSFKALIINQEGENFIREVKSIDKSFLKHGNVLVKVDYSGLNFKDALILKNLHLLLHIENILHKKFHLLSSLLILFHRLI